MWSITCTSSLAEVLTNASLSSDSTAYRGSQLESCIVLHLSVSLYCALELLLTGLCYIQRMRPRQEKLSTQFFSPSFRFFVSALLDRAGCYSHPNSAPLTSAGRTGCRCGGAWTQTRHAHASWQGIGPLIVLTPGFVTTHFDPRDKSRQKTSRQ